MSEVKSDKFWDRVAKKYAKKSVPNEAMYRKKLVETQSYLSPEMNLVEFGCGTGTTAIHHSPFVHDITAVDISSNMLAIGRDKTAEAGINNIQFFLGSLHDLNADTASVDVVLGLNVIHLLPNREAVIAEVFRILKPGGVFISSTGCLGGSYLRFLKLIVPMGKCLGLMPDIFVLTEKRLASEMTDAGFTIESQWHYGLKDIEVFMVVRKTS